MEIYHGSNDTIRVPLYELGKSNNDFGQGFYCTKDIEKAKEWACKNNQNGVVNVYDLNIDNLKILDLTNKKYNVLNWIAILLQNRSFKIENMVSKRAKNFIINNYYIDTTKYDIVIGYRADDSYFSYAQSFIENSLSVEGLEKAMKLGNLGKQIVLVSKKSFANINFIKQYEIDKKEYYERYMNNDRIGRKKYRNIISLENETYIMDIIRNGKTK